MDLAAVLISGAALVVAVFAVGYSRGQRDAAVRQANSSEAQTAYMARQVEVMEKEYELKTTRVEEARGQLTVGGTAAVRTRVPPWTVAHYRGDTYTLTNGSDEAVHDVRIEPPDNTVFRAPERWETIDPHAGENFLLAFTMQSADRKVAVLWRWEPEGEVQSWSSAIPPKR